jgi:hypothetical protein
MQRPRSACVAIAHHTRQLYRVRAMFCLEILRSDGRAGWLAGCCVLALWAQGGRAWVPVRSPAAPSSPWAGSGRWDFLPRFVAVSDFILCFSSRGGFTLFLIHRDFLIRARALAVSRARVCAVLCVSLVIGRALARRGSQRCPRPSSSTSWTVRAFLLPPLRHCALILTGESPVHSVLLGLVEVVSPSVSQYESVGSS